MPRVRDATPEDALAVARVHVRSWQAGYPGLIDDGFLDRLRPKDRAERYTLGAEREEQPYDVVSNVFRMCRSLAGELTLRICRSLAGELTLQPVPRLAIARPGGPG